MNSKQLLLSLLLVGIAFQQPVWSQQPVVKSLASGEVLLEIFAQGESTNQADSITVIVPIFATGETAAIARTANQAIIDRLLKALVDRGIDRNSISAPLPRPTLIGFIGNEAYLAEPNPNVNPKNAEIRTAQSLLRIRVADLVSLQKVYEALDSQNQAITGRPIMELKNNSEARRSAVADAIARAHADAETYASAINYRIARIAKLSNQNLPELVNEDYVALLQGVGSSYNNAPVGDVVTKARVQIDFVLLPR